MATTACSSLQAVPVAFISEVRPTEVQISNGAGVVRTLVNPRLSGDTVMGTALGKPVAIPLREVQRVATVRFSRSRTAMLIGSVVTTTSLIAYVFILDARGKDKVVCDENNMAEDTPLCELTR